MSTFAERFKTMTFNVPDKITTKVSEIETKWKRGESDIISHMVDNIISSYDNNQYTISTINRGNSYDEYELDLNIPAFELGYIEDIDGETIVNLLDNCIDNEDAIIFGCIESLGFETSDLGDAIDLGLCIEESDDMVVLSPSVTLCKICIYDDGNDTTCMDDNDLDGVGQELHGAKYRHDLINKLF